MLPYRTSNGIVPDNGTQFPIGRDRTSRQLTLGANVSVSRASQYAKEMSVLVRNASFLVEPMIPKLVYH